MERSSWRLHLRFRRHEDHANLGATGSCGYQPDEMTSSSTEEYGIVIAGHGSRDPGGVSEFEQLVKLIRERAGRRRGDYGFLEFERPTIDEAVRSSIESGEQRIAVVPLILLAATHAKNDMPSEVLVLL